MTKSSYYPDFPSTVGHLRQDDETSLLWRAPQLVVSIGPGYSDKGQVVSDDLKNEVIYALRGPSPSLPSMLLWDDDGIRNFNELELDPNYYPSQAELDLVTQNADEIALSIPPFSTLIELGCGSMRKTSIILTAFHRLHRPIRYYALDVSAGELQRSLKLLRDKFSHSNVVSIGGLHGTYDDCVSWLRSPSSGLIFQPGDRVTFLWLGNSVANMTPSEATALLGRLHDACSLPRLECNFIIGSDACSDPVTVMRSYSPTYEAISNFIFSGLHCANRLLGQETFPSTAFSWDSHFDTKERRLQVYYVANRRVELVLNQTNEETLAIEQGQKLPIVHSYKWSAADMARICEAAGLLAEPRWKSQQVDYCKSLPPPAAMHQLTLVDSARHIHDPAWKFVVLRPALACR